MERLLKGRGLCFSIRVALFSERPSCRGAHLQVIFAEIFWQPYLDTNPLAGLSGRAAAGGEQAELAEEWESGEHCSGSLHGEPQITGDERDRRLAPGSRTNTEEACKPEPGSLTDRATTLFQMKGDCVPRKLARESSELSAVFGEGL